MNPSGFTGATGTNDGPGQAQWLLCRAGSSLCALPIGAVVETMRALPVAGVADAPDFVRGLAIIRGTPTPVIDTALLLNGRTVPAARLVTLRMGRRLVALMVGEIIGVRRIDRTEEQLPPLLHEAAGHVVAAVGCLDAELLLLLRTARLLPEDLVERLCAEVAG